MSKNIIDSQARKDILEAYDAGWEEILKKSVVDAVAGSTGLDVTFIKSETNIQAPLDLEPDSFISGVIGINAGEIVGNISIMFTKDAIFKIAKTVYDRDVTEVDRSLLDCVGEITNMTYGIFKRGTSDKGFMLKTSLPSVIYGNHSVISLLSSRHFCAQYKLEDQHLFKVSVTIDLGKE